MEFSSAQVQAIGLQVLKSIIQKALSNDYNPFVIFLAGEHIRDIFTINERMLKVSFLFEFSQNLRLQLIDLHNFGVLYSKRFVLFC